VTTWNGKYRSTNNTKNRKRKGKLLPKNEVSGQKAHTNIWKLNRNILTITDLFLDQQRVNICKDGTMWEFLKLSRGTVLTICSHTFVFFWSTKTSVLAEIFLLSFLAFVCLFPLSFPIFLCYNCEIVSDFRQLKSCSLWVFSYHSFLLLHSYEVFEVSLSLLADELRAL
jgi:hypothetical protein